jgi:hypothetical protein
MTNKHLPRIEAQAIAVKFLARLAIELEARQSRYREYLTLNALPFLDEEQGRRFRYLKKQRIIDNRAAFNEARQQLNNKGV